MSDPFRPVDVTRVAGEGRSREHDRAATEEPLEVRLHGRPFAVIMRTPGADRELAAGFLLSERVLLSADDLGTIEYCGNPGNPGNPGNLGNVVNVTLLNHTPEALARVLADRRQVTTNSSCGLCGRLTIESIRSDVPPLTCAWTLAHRVVASMPEALRAAQTVFRETGGLHAAGLFTPDGVLQDIAEDVGRHNAVDKVIGRMLIREALPLSGHALFVSGRTSFEIVQKALFGGIPVVASVSAPSSLAIDLAEEAGITLVGFVRGDRFNIYTHAGRIS